MKKTAQAGIFLVTLALLLSGCGGINVFEFNLFEGLDVVNAGNTVTRVTDPENTTAVNMEKIEELLDSENFTDALAEDPAAKDALLLYLEEVATTGEPEDQQNALALTADVYVKTTGGDDLVNGIASLLNGSVDFETVEDPGAIFENMIPEEADTNDKLAALLTGFHDANGAYEALGNNIDANGLEKEDLNLGNIAQTALIANIVAHAMDDLINEGGMTEDEAALSLAKIMRGEPVDVSFSENYDPFGGMEEGSGVYTLLSLSGLEALFGGGEE